MPVIRVLNEKINTDRLKPIVAQSRHEAVDSIQYTIDDSEQTLACSWANAGDSIATDIHCALRKCDIQRHYITAYKI